MGEPTPGPWYMEQTSNEYGFAICDADSKSFVAVWATSGDGTQFPAKANAQLIAKAWTIPALREALKKIASGTTETFDEDLQENVPVSMDETEMSEIARAALALLEDGK